MPFDLHIRRVTIVVVVSLLCASIAEARILPARPQFGARGALPDRIRSVAALPAHVRTYGMRRKAAGDTATSPKYYRLTNVSAEVGSSSGFATALNNDGRITYNDDQPFLGGYTRAYIVNDHGTFGSLADPVVLPISEYGFLSANALNENAQVVGEWSVLEDESGFSGNLAWTLQGGTGSTIAYYDKTRNGSAADWVNDYDVAVGEDSGLYAAVFENATNPPGFTVDLRGIKGSSCGNSSAQATGINNAGEIVGTACVTAVRFSMSGYAQPIAMPSKVTASGAQAVNQAGDIVGFAGNVAFLNHAGRTTYLPLPQGDKGSAEATAINTGGEIVGTISNADSLIAAFLYVNGRSYDLDTLLPPNSGWELISATGINDRGEIVANGYYNGTLYGVSLKPPKT